MVLVCAMMRKIGGQGRAPAVFLTFIFMRAIQVICNVLESCALKSGSRGVRISLFFVFLVIYIAMQSHMSYFLIDIYDDRNLRDDMLIACGEIVFLMELFLWDTVIVPIFMALMGKAFVGFRSFCNKLKLPNKCC